MSTNWGHHTLVCIELEGFNYPNCFDDTIIPETDSWDIYLSSIYNKDTVKFISMVNLKKDGDFLSGVIISNYIRITNDSIVPDSMYVQGFIDAAKSETPVVYLYFTAYGSAFLMKARLSANLTSLYNGVLYQYVTDKPYDLSMGKTSPVMKNTTLLANFSGTKSVN